VTEPSHPSADRWLPPANEAPSTYLGWLPPAAGSPAAPPAYGLAPATWGRRAGAAVIDLVFVLAVAMCIASAASLISDPTVVTDSEGFEYPLSIFIWAGLVIVFSLTYPWLWMGATGGRTVGRAALRIRVVREDGTPVGYRLAFSREILAKGALGFFTIPLLVSYLWPLGDKHQRALHDLMCSTRAVRD
jgi:uncharacterized RDD family membrane protein YckC